MNCPVSPRKEEEIGDVSGSEGDVWDRAMEPFEHEEGEPEEARKVVGVREEEQPSEQEVKEHMETTCHSGLGAHSASKGKQDRHGTERERKQ